MALCGLNTGLMLQHVRVLSSAHDRGREGWSRYCRFSVGGARLETHPHTHAALTSRTVQYVRIRSIGHTCNTCSAKLQHAYTLNAQPLTHSLPPPRQGNIARSAYANVVWRSPPRSAHLPSPPGLRLGAAVRGKVIECTSRCSATGTDAVMLAN